MQHLLNLISGHAELLLHNHAHAHLRDPRVREGLESIVQAAVDASSTLRPMEAQAREDAAPPTPEPIDLNVAVKDALTASRPHWFGAHRWGEHEVTVRLDLTPELPPLVGQPSEIRGVLLNLILNAVDAMPRGGTLTIRTRARGAGPRYLDAVLADNGVGMTREVRERAFEPYFTTKRKGGRGLGLSVALDLLRQHQARVSLRSRPGAGSIFRLRFPLEPRGAEPTPIRPRPSG